MEILTHTLEDASMITVFVLVMMIFTDYLNVLTKGKLSQLIKGGLLRQYIMASFLGATPGCLGAFMNVSFYIQGLISLGALVGGMIATSGDESFVMLALFPFKALILFTILFILGIVSSYIVDKLVPFLKIKLSPKCELGSFHFQEECRCLNLKEIISQFKKMSLSRFLILFILIVFMAGFISGLIGPKDWGWEKITFVSLMILGLFIVITVPEHFLEEHIWQHIFKKHIWRVFLWTLGALLVIEIGLKFWDLETIVKDNMAWVLLIASLIGIIPESGPHMIFVTMFAKGFIPFSVLLASSIVQDGHGMLPLLSYSLRDSFWVKLFNFILGLGIGVVLYLLGF